MAKIERVTITCDGPCGGNEIDPDTESSFVLRRAGGPNKSIDLCVDCAPAFNEMYERGTVMRVGRPATPRRAQTVNPSGEPAGVTTAHPTPAPVVEPTTAATIPVDRPVSGMIVSDPFAEAPVGTGT